MPRIPAPTLPPLLAVLAIALLITSLTRPAGASDALLDAKRDAAAKLLKDGKTADAQKLYEEVIAADDSNWSDHYALAKIYDKAGDTGKAVERYRQAVKELKNRARSATERSALSDSEKRLKVLDELSGKLDGAMEQFVRQLRELSKEAEKTNNLFAQKRIDSILSALAIRSVVEVSAKSEWQDSGIDLLEGQEYRFTTSGTWTMSVRVANGATTARGTDVPGALYKGLPYGMLIARINNSDVIAIGESKTFRAPASGRLFLRANDDAVADNDGTISVGIEVR